MSKAYTIPQSFSPTSSLTNVSVAYQAAVGDGVNPVKVFSSEFDFDATLTPAQNLANLKASVVAAAAIYGYTLVAADVSVFTAIN